MGVEVRASRGDVDQLQAGGAEQPQRLDRFVNIEVVLRRTRQRLAETGRGVLRYGTPSKKFIRDAENQTRCVGPQPAEDLADEARPVLEAAAVLAGPRLGREHLREQVAVALLESMKSTPMSRARSVARTSTSCSRSSSASVMIRALLRSAGSWNRTTGDGYDHRPECGQLAARPGSRPPARARFGRPRSTARARVGSPPTAAADGCWRARPEQSPSPLPTAAWRRRRQPCPPPPDRQLVRRAVERAVAAFHRVNRKAIAGRSAPNPDWRQRRLDVRFEADADAGAARSPLERLSGGEDGSAHAQDTTCMFTIRLRSGAVAPGGRRRARSEYCGSAAKNQPPALSFYAAGCSRVICAGDVRPGRRAWRCKGLLFRKG